MPNVVKKTSTQESAPKTSTGVTKPSSSPTKPKVGSRKSAQKPELKEIPQRDLDISTATAEELKGEGFKFPSFNEMTDWLAKEWYMVGNNPYIQMWTDETDPEKKKQLYDQAVIYQHEMEKNAEEAAKDYNKNEQSGVASWLGENLDMFDALTSWASLGLLGPVKIAKMGPLARTVGEAGLQAGLEGLHSGIEGESVAGGAVAGGLSGLAPIVPAFKENKNQAARREILKPAEPLMKGDKGVEKTVKSRLNKMSDKPLMTEAEETAYLKRNIPESKSSEYMPGDIRDERGVLTSPGFETTLANDMTGTFGEPLVGKLPRGEVRPFLPSQTTGEPPLLNTLLDLFPERVNPQGNPAYYWSDVVNGLLNWKPRTQLEKKFKNYQLSELLWNDNLSLVLPREKLLEDYPGIGLAALQPVFNSVTDVSREGIKDVAEGASDVREGLKGMYSFGKNLTEDEDLKEGLGILKEFAKE